MQQLWLCIDPNLLYLSKWLIQTNDCKDKVQKQTPARVQADTNFKHASALLVAQPDEVFHHPDNKEILHSSVLASTLLVTIEATNVAKNSFRIRH